jgi:hypothetical protein
LFLGIFWKKLRVVGFVVFAGGFGDFACLVMVKVW